MGVRQLALTIATVAHAGQTEHGGNPYIDHPVRVAKIAEQYDPGDYLQAVALLHDVLEDSAVTADDLRALGVPTQVVYAVELLTRDRDTDSAYFTTYAGFIAKIVQSDFPLAIMAKIADIRDHLRPEALSFFDGERLYKRHQYERALVDLEDALEYRDSGQDWFMDDALEV